MTVSLFWRWSKALPQSACDAVISEVLSSQMTAGVVGQGPGSGVRPEIRDANVFFLNRNHWLEGVLINHTRYANESAKWGFVISGSENVQVSSYDSGQFYDWHQDADFLVAPTDAQRKLTAVIQLSPAESFEGGGLLIHGYEETVLSEQGDIVVFPSFVRHTALPVTSGKRVTASLWVTGPNFV